MAVVEKLMEDQMVVVSYDFKANPKGNSQRIKFHRIITGQPFYASMMNQSVYYMYASLASLSFVRSWADETNADIKVFGMGDIRKSDARRYAKQYVDNLKEMLQEVYEIAEHCRDKLLEFEENIEDPEYDLRGIPAKIAGAEQRFEEMRKAINKIQHHEGEEKAKRDEFKLDVIAVFFKNLKERYDRVKEMRLKVMSQ